MTMAQRSYPRSWGAPDPPMADLRGRAV